MLQSTSRPVIVAWLIAVLGALTILVSPITPYLLVLEVAGVATCVVAGVLAAVSARR